MGLDLLELTMAYEEAFGLSLDTPTWQPLRTPRHLIAHLAEVLPLADTGCTSQQAFYTIRRGVVTVCNVSRQSVHPTTEWRDLLPQAATRATWRRIGASVSPGYWPERWLLGGPRADHATVGDLATFLATTQPARIKRQPASWSPEEIETVVRAVLREEQGLDQVSLDADFVTDLGLS